MPTTQYGVEFRKAAGLHEGDPAWNVTLVEQCHLFGMIRTEATKSGRYYVFAFTAPTVVQLAEDQLSAILDFVTEANEEMHEAYSTDAWRQAVADGETVLGYDDWVVDRKEQAARDAAEDDET